MQSYNYIAGSSAQQQELAAKRLRIEQFMKDQQLDALVINTQKNFAWATAGANNWVSIAGEQGIASLVFRADGRAYVVADNLELPRLIEEEKLEQLGFEVIGAPWWEAANRQAVLLDLAGSNRVGCDANMQGTHEVGAALGPLRWSLLPEERDRYRQVCQASAEALETTCHEIIPGMSEWAVAGYVAQACYERNLIPFVTLVAADERIYNYRHPIPTRRLVDRYVMVVLCAKAGGLIANCTRLVSFGPVPAEILQKHRSVQMVDATFNLNTRPGARAGQIFAQAQQAYVYSGYPGEWELHHQGGATGYDGRDYRAGPDSQEVVQEWQAFAWNPSITGTKSEDTVLVSSQNGHEIEILTTFPASTWPMATVTIEGLGSLQRPEILEK